MIMLPSPKFDVGDTVFVHEPETDTVSRGVVELVRLERGKAGAPWNEKYQVRFSNPNEPMVLSLDRLQASPTFP